MICYAPISYLFLTLAVERIMKGIADNFSELINEENNFCLPISNRSSWYNGLLTVFRAWAVLNLPAYAFKLLNKRRDFLENALLFGFVLWIKRTHFRQC